MRHQTRALLVSLIGLGLALAALSALPLSAAGGSTDVLGPQTVSATVAMPVDIHAEVTAMDCDNSPGRSLSIRRRITLGLNMLSEQCTLQASSPRFFQTILTLRLKSRCVWRLYCTI